MGIAQKRKEKRLVVSLEGKILISDVGIISIHWKPHDLSILLAKLKKLISIIYIHQYE